MQYHHKTLCAIAAGQHVHCRGQHVYCRGQDMYCGGSNCIKYDGHGCIWGDNFNSGLSIAIAYILTHSVTQLQILLGLKKGEG